VRPTLKEPSAILDLALRNRLKALREAQGLSLVALAARVGVSSQQIGHLELGKRHLTVEWLTRLADALGSHPWAIVTPALAANLTKPEKALLAAFRALPESKRKRLVDALAVEASDASK
jgi:transcriptional regulator with XRE-family HTH domain